MTRICSIAFMQHVSELMITQADARTWAGLFDLRSQP